MDHNSSRKSNKISDIVRLHQLLKKWKRLANNNSSKSTNNNNSTVSGTKSINKFLKKTLSFSESTAALQESNVVPKGCISICVGKELKRFTIPTEYLSHRAFAVLLREAEEEFGFQQEGVLKFPCEVEVFEKVLKMMGSDNRKCSSSISSSRADQLFLNVDDDDDNSVISCDSVHRHDHPQMMCR